MVWYWHKDTHVEQWNKTESPEKKQPCIYGQMSFDRSANTIQHHWNK